MTAVSLRQREVERGKRGVLFGGGIIPMEWWVQNKDFPFFSFKLNKNLNKKKEELKVTSLNLHHAVNQLLEDFTQRIYKRLILLCCKEKRLWYYCVARLHTNHLHLWLILSYQRNCCIFLNDALNSLHRTAFCKEKTRDGRGDDFILVWYCLVLCCGVCLPPVAN